MKKETICFASEKNKAAEKSNTINIALLGKKPDTGELPLIFILVFHTEKETGEFIKVPSDTRATISSENSWNRTRFSQLLLKGASREEIKYNLEQVSGKEIDHYARINLEGAIKIVDELGGVNLQVNKPVVHPGFQLGKGEHHLDGKKTIELFTRELPGNHNRGEKLIRALLQRSYDVTRGELLPSLIWIGLNNTSTDIGLTDLWELHKIARTIQIDQVSLTPLEPGA